MTPQFFIDKRPHRGLTYRQFLDNWNAYLKNTNSEELSEEDKQFYNYKKLNRSRSSRIEKTYSAGTEITNLVSKINSPQLWMILTEDWCGDSAQILPHIAAIADLNSNIELRILYRDKNLDIMDMYLTNGKSRSIPKLVAFDQEGNEIFKWGPRPKAAQKLVDDELAKGREKQDVYQDLHMWYSKDKGNEIEKEFVELLNHN